MLRVVAPGAAAEGTLRLGSALDPFPDIAAHVVKAEGIGREAADRGGVGVAVGARQGFERKPGDLDACIAQDRMSYRPITMF